MIIATDILSRGIDIDDIEMVINYDVPRDPEDYIHRIGRTARADRDGRAVTFVSPEEAFRLKRIENCWRKKCRARMFLRSSVTLHCCSQEKATGVGDETTAERTVEIQASAAAQAVHAAEGQRLMRV